MFSSQLITIFYLLKKNIFLYLMYDGQFLLYSKMTQLHTYFFSHIILHHDPSQVMRYSSLCYRAGCPLFRSARCNLCGALFVLWKVLLAPGGRRPGMLLKHPLMQGQALMSKNVPAQSVGSAEAEKPCFHASQIHHKPQFSICMDVNGTGQSSRRAQGLQRQHSTVGPWDAQLRHSRRCLEPHRPGCPDLFFLSHHGTVGIFLS